LYEPVGTTIQVRSDPSTPRPAAFLPVDALVQSSPIVALLAGLTAAFAGSAVPVKTATAVAAITKRIKEFFLIDEISIISTFEGEG
jgi:hypothetical protein